MNLKLNTSTKKAFLAIISSIGIEKTYAVFRQFLTTGKPIKIDVFAEIMNTTEPEAIALAKNKGEINDQGYLVGFLGFSLVATDHQLMINGIKFYTWCAADTLIFPLILEVEAEITSTDPINNESVNIRVNRNTLAEIKPETAMISWIDDVDEDDIRCSMCNRVHFFASATTATIWLKNNQDARVFSVADYYTNGIDADE